MKNSWRCWISSLLLLAFLAGCLPAEDETPAPPWQYADLRLLASPGDGRASHQLISLYTRRHRSEIQIRLDLLDFEPEIDYDLYLAFDTSTGGVTALPLNATAGLNWDFLLFLPADGPLQAIEPEGINRSGLQLRAVRNSTLDTVVISLASTGLPKAFNLQVFLTPVNSPDVASSLGPVRSDAWPPARLPVLLAFWDTFPAYTPAQALRRFDGAHSGPASDRHGLRGLLDAIAATRFPALLLDIKTPLALSALDFAGGMPQLLELAARDLLILPDALPLDVPDSGPFSPPDWAQLQAAQTAIQVSRQFGLPSSPFLYMSSLPNEFSRDFLHYLSDYRLIFISNDRSRDDSPGTIPLSQSLVSSNMSASLFPELSRLGASSVVNFTVAQATLLATTQATSTGPALEIRRSLLEAAVSSQGNQFLVLGGDLAQTAWGNPQAATQTLRYFASRPWLQPVTQTMLSALPAPSTSSSSALSAPLPPEASAPSTLFDPQGEPIASGLNAPQVQDLLLNEMKSTPENNALLLARQAYAALLSPAVLDSPQLPLLQAAYLGQVGHLLAAAQWGADGLQAHCDPANETAACRVALDVDWDGEQEYLLFSTSFFGVIEKRGGYMALAFTQDSNGLHQVIAPSSQFVVGMGDPQSWKTQNGLAGDPSQLRGAFSDLPGGSASPSWAAYTVSFGEDTLTFTAPDLSISKTYRLTLSGLQIDYVSSQPLMVQIPLAIKPDSRFYPGWGSRYLEERTPGGISFGLQNGIQMNVLTEENFTARSFSDSLPFMGQPENPDLDYPPGHFLPFPLALVEISAQGDFSIQLEVISNTQP